MKSLADGLPPQIAQQIHPDWRKNESDYWAVRDQLLTEYRDQWIGFANGTVIVSGASPVEVFHKAQSLGQHPFVTCVGREHEASRRAARVSRMTRRILVSRHPSSVWSFARASALQEG
jgi:hypothetical protein